jgi:hypothetical protein
LREVPFPNVPLSDVDRANLWSNAMAMSMERMPLMPADDRRHRIQLLMQRSEGNAWADEFGAAAEAHSRMLTPAGAPAPDWAAEFARAAPPPTRFDDVEHFEAWRTGTDAVDGDAWAEELAKSAVRDDLRRLANHVRPEQRRRADDDDNDGATTTTHTRGAAAGEQWAREFDTQRTGDWDALWQRDTESAQWVAEFREQVQQMGAPPARAADAAAAATSSSASKAPGEVWADEFRGELATGSSALGERFARYDFAPDNPFMAHAAPLDAGRELFANGSLAGE